MLKNGILQKQMFINFKLKTYAKVNVKRNVCLYLNINTPPSLQKTNKKQMWWWLF